MENCFKFFIDKELNWNFKQKVVMYDMLQKVQFLYNP